MTSVLKIEYSGTEASCLIIADATAETITSKIGADGSESNDPNFGSSGVLDISGYETLEDIVEVIDAYTDYSASIHTGDDTTPADGLLDLETVAKPTAAYVVFFTTSPLKSYALITWQDAKTYLNLLDEQEGYAALLINGASRQANRYSRRHLKAKDYSELHDGTGNSLLILRQFPVNSVTDVRVDSGRTFASDSIVTDYLIYEELGQLRRKSGVWAEIRQSIQVNYNAGFVDVPEDLQIAVLEVVAFNWKRFQSKAIGTRSQTADGVTTEYELTVPTNAQRVFESYGA